MGFNSRFEQMYFQRGFIKMFLNPSLWCTVSQSSTDVCKGLIAFRTHTINYAHCSKEQQDRGLIQVEVNVTFSRGLGLGGGGY
jgi:hypothetical protein